MIFYPIRYLVTGIVVGVIIMTLSNDYVIISRRKYEKMKKGA